MTDTERDQSIRLIGENRDHCYQYRQQLKAEGRSPEEVKRLLDPMVTMRKQMEDDVLQYNGLRAGVFPLISHDWPQIAVLFCRIASGKTQEEFSQMRGVPLEELCRQERNEYYGLSYCEAERLVNLLGYHLNSVSRYEIVKNISEK